jgi:hypothetical protein
LGLANIVGMFTFILASVGIFSVVHWGCTAIIGVKETFLGKKRISNRDFGR